MLRVISLLFEFGSTVVASFYAISGHWEAAIFFMLYAIVFSINNIQYRIGKERGSE